MATANFQFTTLTGTETAGWNSINTLISSIDTQLNTSNRLVYMSGWSAVAGQTIKWDAVNSRWVPGTLDSAAFANNSVELGTKTTGNYVATVAGQANETEVSGSGSETAAVTIRLANNTALRGEATVESAPNFDPAYMADNKIVDTDFVLDALSYATTGGVTLSGDVTGATNSNIIANNAVSNAKLRDSSGLSVIGRSANSTGDPADIVGSANQVLRVSGTTLGFGTITSDMIENNTIVFDDLAAALQALLVPTGSIQAYAGDTTPTGWLICNGDTVPNGTGTVQGFTANFAALYAVLGSTYGSAGALPDLRGRTIAGVDSTGLTNIETSPTRLRPVSASAATRGSVIGDARPQQHTHTQNSHSHSFTVRNDYLWPGIGSSGAAGAAEAGNWTLSSSPVGATTATNQNTFNGGQQNVQPTMVLNYLIKV